VKTHKIQKVNKIKRLVEEDVEFFESHALPTGKLFDNKEEHLMGSSDEEFPIEIYEDIEVEGEDPTEFLQETVPEAILTHT